MSWACIFPGSEFYTPSLAFFFLSVTTVLCTERSRSFYLSLGDEWTLPNPFIPLLSPLVLPPPGPPLSYRLQGTSASTESLLFIEEKRKKKLQLQRVKLENVSGSYFCVRVITLESCVMLMNDSLPAKRYIGQRERTVRPRQVSQDHTTAKGAFLF